MNKCIVDGMKKEGKTFGILMVFGYGLFAFTFLYSFINDKNIFDDDVLMMLLVYFSFGTFGLYSWLYAIQYKLEINENEIKLRTLFKNIKIKIYDIEKYTCMRYKKSEFYQFTLFIKEKRILVNTRFKEEFEQILNERESII